MQHISKNLRRNVEHASTLSLKIEPERISRKWTDALFLKFSHIWPTKWADIMATHNHDALAEEWQKGLAGMGGEQIGKALDICRKTCDWPPSIAEFRSAGIVKTENLAMYRRNEDVLRLPETTWAQRREIAKSCIQAAKEALK